MKIEKIILIILGACNKVMTMFIPTAVALLLINMANINNASAIILMSIAIASTFFRGLRDWLN